MTRFRYLFSKYQYYCTNKYGSQMLIGRFGVNFNIFINIKYIFVFSVCYRLQRDNVFSLHTISNEKKKIKWKKNKNSTQKYIFQRQKLYWTFLFLLHISMMRIYSLWNNFYLLSSVLERKCWIWHFILSTNLVQNIECN